MLSRSDPNLTWRPGCMTIAFLREFNSSECPRKLNPRSRLTINKNSNCQACSSTGWTDMHLPTHKSAAIRACLSHFWACYPGILEWVSSLEQGIASGGWRVVVWREREIPAKSKPRADLTLFDPFTVDWLGPTPIFPILTSMTSLKTSR